jgi:hypothetical protein
MVPSKGTRADLLLKVLNRAMVLTIKILLVWWLNLLLFDFCYLWLLQRGGIFVSLTFRMPFYTVFLRRRFICVSLLALKILLILVIFVALIRLSMDSNRLLVLGMLV